jgi:dynein heavy chain, axonemal
MHNNSAHHPLLAGLCASILLSGGCAGEEPGPDTELEYWRSRMAKFNSITEQLKSKDCKVVLGVTHQARSPVHKRWKGLDVHITDAANESKDNIKYLATLEKSFETMYMGKPQEIIDCLPALMNNIKMMYTIARYYGTPEKMTILFTKITNQMIRNCKEQIISPGKIWDQEKPALISSMQVGTTCRASTASTSTSAPCSCVVGPHSII